MKSWSWIVSIVAFFFLLFFSNSTSPTVRPRARHDHLISMLIRHICQTEVELKSHCDVTQATQCDAVINVENIVKSPLPVFYILGGKDCRPL